MLFNSWQFALFFPIVTVGYFALPHRVRWFWLLVASCCFYMAFVPAYILILACTITVDYFAGILIARSQGLRRRMWLMLSVFANLGMLGFFKYFNFFNANLALLATWLDWHYSIGALSILLPIGLSFHVFQSLSYTIEVYRGAQAPERHLGIFALYVMFYPQLVAGPIERPQNLLHQFREVHTFELERINRGLKRMLWGLFKKVVIADRLALAVGPIFAAPQHYTGLPLIVATLCFTFQIYCDFSGYSDIALGSAEVMGFTLMENFKRPYFSRSVAEFWTRWHVSLSSWFRDYVYIPLGGNRVAPARWGCNILVVFMASGLWHGANWTFVVWGAIHGTALLLERTCERFLQTLPGFVRVAGTFCLVAIAWIFFRATSLTDAWYIVSHLMSGLPQQLHSGADMWAASRELGRKHLVFGLVGVLILLMVEAWPYSPRPRWAVWGLSYAMVVALIVLGVYDNRAFIYFQF